MAEAWDLDCLALPMTLLKMGCWEAGPGPGCGPGGAHPLEVWVRINSAFLALLKTVVTLSPGPALPYTELYYVPPTLLHLSHYLKKIILITASQGRDSYIPHFYMGQRNSEQTGLWINVRVSIGTQVSCCLLSSAGRLKDGQGLGSNLPRWKLLQERLRMLADSPRPAGPVSSLCRGRVVAASPGTWPPCLQQCTGLPMLGSEHSSWGCFLPAEHVLSLSICCPASPDTALGPSSQNRCLCRKEGRTPVGTHL